MTRASIPTTTGQNRNVTRPDYWLAKFSKLRIHRLDSAPPTRTLPSGDRRLLSSESAPASATAGGLDY